MVILGPFNIENFRLCSSIILSRFWSNLLFDLNNFFQFQRGVDTGISADSMKPATKFFVYAMGLISFPFFLYMPSVRNFLLLFFKNRL